MHQPSCCTGFVYYRYCGSDLRAGEFCCGMHGGQEQDMCKPYHLMWSGRRVLRRKGSSSVRPIILLEMLALYCIVPNRSRCCDVVRALPSLRVSSIPQLLFHVFDRAIPSHRAMRIQIWQTNICHYRTHPCFGRVSFKHARDTLYGSRHDRLG